MNINAPLDATAVHAATQHAVAGRAALGLLQDTANEAKNIDPDSGILDHVQNLVQFAQKAEMSRKILERYLLGTEITRIDPVYVPSPPPSYSEYSYPNLDPSVTQSKHMPINVNPTPRPMLPWGTAPRTAGPMSPGPMPSRPLGSPVAPVARASFCQEILVMIPRTRTSISNFI